MNKKNELKLINAIKNQDLKKIKKLIKNGANINGIWDGKIPLIYAAKIGDEAIVNYLIANGANVNYLVKHNTHDLIANFEYFLQLSVKYNFWNKYSRYFDIIDFVTKEGDTPLTIAAENGYPKIVEKLAYTIYEQEKWKRYQWQLPNFINISTDKNVKTLQELANDVQKTITGIDFKDPSPYQTLETNLNLLKLKINNEILNKINERVEKKKFSWVKEANAIDFQNEGVRSNKNNYCSIL
ncbi:ankyrin repeat domain-containing protein [Spiroplasma endosymbiont of Polydrusus pterygomalis]|uniref:ankyrin repeat domain-containing protein n=1 Tax=Spiroplasma endosymbiont of Polydrusus pterygomalis TaxID=3139327 RepID=UPI003CCB647C